MQVTFFSGFKKRINSTKRPIGGTALECLMKDKTDFHNPTLKLQTDATDYNYMQIGKYYYYITNVVTMPAGWVEYTGEMDPMATCAEDIKATRVFVERSRYGTVNIIDNLAPATTDNVVLQTATGTLFTPSNTGSYILTFNNMPFPVKMSLGEFTALYNRLNSQDITEQVQNFFADFSNFVTGAIWLPISGIDTAGTVELKAGKVDLGISASIISNDVKTWNTTIGLALDDTVLTSSQYCSISVQLPFSGCVKLSPDDFKQRKSMSITANVDCTNGAIQYVILGDGSGTIATFSGSCGIPIPVGSTSYNVGSFAGGFITTLASIMSANPVGVASGAWGMFNGLRSSSQGGGGGSASRAGIAWPVVRVCVEQHPAPETLTLKTNVVGLPTMKTMQLSSVSGFVKCINATVETEHIELAETCNNYLNNGAWIE